MTRTRTNRALHRRDRRGVRPPAIIVAAVCGAILLSLPAGCVEEKTVSDPWIELRRFADPRTDAKDAAARNGQGNPAVRGYAILLKRFEGGDQQSKAQKFVTDLLAKAGLRDVWFTSAGNHTYVYRGRYSDPQHPGATVDLNDTRTIEIDGETPFANAAVVTIGVDADVAASEFDLRRFPGKYSLQIGYYDAQFGATYRSVAETAVARLREDGEDAYFYHGPTMSMVTIGVFGNEDIQQRVYRDPNNGRDTIQPIYSERVAALQGRFPRNVANGRINELAPDGKPPPSFLIRVPY